MSILTENSKKMLVESMRECLSEVLHESTSLTSKQATEKIKFVTESATYEQLLNITLNPRRQEKYQPAYVLEGAVAILHSACMTGRKHIGVNAITEGALKLQKKTGAVITESMLDAALLAVNEGAGLKVVGKLLNEAALQDVLGLSNSVYGAWKSSMTDNGSALIANRANLQNELLAKAQTLGFKDPALTARTWTNDIIAAARSGDAQKMSAVKRQIFRASREGIQRNAAKALDTTAPGSLAPRKLRQLQRHANIGNTGGRIGNLGNTVNGAASKGGWGKYALGAAAIGGLGALGYQYYKNRKAMNRDIQNGIEQ